MLLPVQLQVQQQRLPEQVQQQAPVRVLEQVQQRARARAQAPRQPGSPSLRASSTSA